MVMANKWVLAEHPGTPIFFLWTQLAVAVVLLMISHAINWIRLPTASSADTLDSDPSSSSSSSLSDYFPALDWRKASQCKSLIAVNVIGLTLNTLCLKDIDASLFQVARSLVLPFTVLLQYVVLKQPSTMGVLLSCAIVCSGFWVGLFGTDAKFTKGVTMSGVVFGILSSITTALHAIVIKSSMGVFQGNMLEMAWYNNVLSAIGMLPVVLMVGELPSIISLFNGGLQQQMNDKSNTSSSALSTFMVGVLVTGIFGFLINIAGFLQIKVTSPVTHMVSSAVRGVLQTFLAVWLFNDVLTGARVSGIVLILGGSTAYTWLRQQASVPQAHSPRIKTKDMAVYVQLEDPKQVEMKEK